MRIFLFFLLGNVVSFNLLAQGPMNGEVSIKNAVVNGSGCPSGSASVIVTNSTPNGPIDYFQVTFDDFVVEKPGRSRKFCNVLLDLKYPDGWSFSLIDVETDGYGEIQDGHRGQIDLQYNFRNLGTRPAKKSRRQKGYWEGEYTFNDKFGSVVWSKCGKVVPVNLKTTIKLTGKSNSDDPSLLTVDRQSGLLTQLWGISWTRC